MTPHVVWGVVTVTVPATTFEAATAAETWQVMSLEVKEASGGVEGVETVPERSDWVCTPIVVRWDKNTEWEEEEEEEEERKVDVRGTLER